IFLNLESLNEAGDVAAENGDSVQIKEEEEETAEQPAAKRRRGQSKSAAKTKDMPKEEIKTEEVVRTVVMKGKAPVDSECKAKLGKAHVYSEGNDVYDVMLNQVKYQKINLIDAPINQPEIRIHQFSCDLLLIGCLQVKY
uniref:Uncharacterized protein n=1 Tax=Poecilia latipinna TaxID=48699 RepID=A0A3B3TX57_9TELE